LHDKIKDKCEIKLNSSVTNIIEASAMTMTPTRKYDLFYLEKDGEEKICRGFDEVVLCTNAEISASILSDTLLRCRNICDVLKSVEYYDTTICFHEAPDDTNYNKQIVVHIDYDGEIASTHVLKSWNSNIMKSWIFNEKYPEKYYNIVRYRHPYMYESYYNAQENIKLFNNLLCGISFGSIMANKDDSHESGILASVQVAKNLTKKYNLSESNKLKIFDGINYDSDNGCKHKCGCSCLCQ
jgi:hypothetical protein